MCKRARTIYYLVVICIVWHTYYFSGIYKLSSYHCKVTQPQPHYKRWYTQRKINECLEEKLLIQKTDGLFGGDRQDDQNDRIVLLRTVETK